MKVLILGSNGQVGWELMRASWPAQTIVAGFTRPVFDLTRADSLEPVLDRVVPDVVINAAAYTAVDKAESQHALAFAANCDGPARLAGLCAARGLPLLHLSTDYVFDGRKTRPYTEDDPVCPLGVYGASKAAGEQAVRTAAPRHIILRTAWVYGVHGSNFVKTMVGLAGERPEVSVVCDQQGTPTAAADLAAALVMLSGRAAGAPAAVPWGTYHFAGSGAATWYDLAEHVFEHRRRVTGERPRLRAIATADYPTAALRPADSRLDCGRSVATFGLTAPPWRDSLDRVLTELDRRTDPGQQGGQDGGQRGRGDR
ncbi:MAG: dTDP-4-dehydrorhamnose reductase [Azospirillum sp.]|nr:dTDP-4-dehydrorhamnose reductase [Azospirillum sp.]